MILMIINDGKSYFDTLYQIKYQVLVQHPHVPADALAPLLPAAAAAPGCT
jgi:hypothetical protein